MNKTIILTYGNPNFRGQKKISIDASGAVEAFLVQGEQVSTFSGEIGSEESTALWGVVEQAKVCELERSRPGVPGEDILEFELVEEDSGCTGEAWTNDQDDNANLKALFDRLNAIGFEISNGIW